MITFALTLKLLGSVSLFASVGVLSLYAKMTDKERLLRIDAQMKFVGFVRERIDRYLLPIGEILRECDNDMLDSLCIGCQKEFEAMDAEGLRAILRSGRYYADGGAIFDSFLARLGSSYREDEVAACDVCLRELSEIRQKLSAELPKERKSKAVLGFCLAAALVIIMF